MLTSLTPRECLYDEDFGVGGDAVGEGLLVAQELIADEDVDVLAQGALLVDDVIAQPAPALVDGGDDLGDGGGVDGAFAEVGEEAFEVGREFDLSHGRELERKGRYVTSFTAAARTFYTLPPSSPR